MEKGIEVSRLLEVNDQLVGRIRRGLVKSLYLGVTNPSRFSESDAEAIVDDMVQLAVMHIMQRIEQAQRAK